MLKPFILLHKLKRNIYRDPLEIKANQFKSLKRLLIHAYNNTGYYKKMFDGTGS